MAIVDALGLLPVEVKGQLVDRRADIAEDASRRRPAQ
jgi:hypothetical protein